MDPTVSASPCDFDTLVDGNDTWEILDVANLSLKIDCEDDMDNTTDPVDHYSDHYSTLMTPPLQILWALLFACMLVVAIVGNVIVIWTIIAHRRMRTVTNYFLVNLSLADLLMSLFNCAFNFVYMVNNDWYFGRSYCTVNNFIANVTVSASVFTLMSITIDRYLAIVRPLKPRITKCKAQFTILIIWSSSLILAIPCLLYSTTITYKQNEQTACIMVWPDGQPMVSQMDYLYTIVLFLTTYLIPMTAMVCCYASMARHLWGSLSIGELTTCQQECIRAKRKVVRMFLVVVSVFGVCWLPYHSYFIYTYHKKEFVYSKYVQHLYLGFYWLAMANAMMNPLIYYCMNTRLREYFRQIVCCAKASVEQSSNRRYIYSCTSRKSGIVCDVGGRRLLTRGSNEMTSRWSIRRYRAPNNSRASETTVSVESDQNTFRTMKHSRNSIKSCFNSDTSQV